MKEAHAQSRTRFHSSPSSTRQDRIRRIEQAKRLGTKLAADHHLIVFMTSPSLMTSHRRHGAAIDDVLGSCD